MPARPSIISEHPSLEVFTRKRSSDPIPDGLEKRLKGDSSSTSGRGRRLGERITAVVKAVPHERLASVSRMSCLELMSSHSERLMMVGDLFHMFLLVLIPG